MKLKDDDVCFFILLRASNDLKVLVFLSWKLEGQWINSHSQSHDGGELNVDR